MKILSNKRRLSSQSTEENIASAEQVFLDDYFLFKTDIGRYELFIILRPRKLNRSRSLPDNSESVIDHNYTNELFSIIRHYLAQCKHVEKILFLKKEDVFHIWTVNAEYDIEENRKAVYTKEMELMTYLSKVGFHFDFYIIEPDDVDEVLSSGASIIYNKPRLS